MTFKAINTRVKAILSTLGTNDLPIKIEEVAKRRGLKVIPYPLEQDLSGILVIDANGSSTIGYNQHESRVRRRFTIAHELGHYELHKDKSSLFVDKNFKVMFRNASEPDHSNAQFEQEANVFAAYILMPDDFVAREIENLEFDLGSEESIRELAKRFEVSTTAMYYRLLNFGKL